MSRQRLEWKVGLFVFTSLVLLGLLLLNFSKGLAFFKPTYTLRLKASNVGGLKRQAGVLMAGVQVGVVTEADLAPDGRSVTLFLKISQRYPIQTNAVFTIDSMGFLGDQYVAVTPRAEDAPFLRDGDEVVSSEPFNLQEVARSAAGFIHRIDETARNLNNALTRVDRHVLDEETLTNLAVSIRNFRRVSDRALATVDGIDSLVQSNAPPLNAALTNLVLFSRQLREVAVGFEQVLATNQTGLNAAVKNIESSSAIVKGLLAEFEAGKGLAGSLLRDEQLDTAFSQMVSNLSVLSSNLNRHGLLWKPGKTQMKPPSPSYPGRDPRR